MCGRSQHIHTTTIICMYMQGKMSRQSEEEEESSSDCTPCSLQTLTLSHQAPGSTLSFSFSADDNPEEEEEKDESPILIAPLDLTVACDPSAASIFAEGLHLAYSYLNRYDWLAATRACRQWHLASQTSPYPRFPFILHNEGYPTLSYPDLLPLSRLSLRYRTYISSFNFDSLDRSGSFLNGFWRINASCFRSYTRMHAMNTMDLAGMIKLLPKLKQIKGFTLKELDAKATKPLIFDGLEEDKKVKKGKHGKQKKRKPKTILSTPSVSTSPAQMLAPLAAARIETLWFSLYEVRSLAVDVVSSLSIHCPALTSLALDGLSMNVPLAPLSSLPRLTHLALPDYLLLVKVRSATVPDDFIYIFPDGAGKWFDERMRELASLTSLRALCLNNDALGKPRKDPVAFLERLHKKSIIFMHLNDFAMHLMHPTQEPYRTPLQAVMPNLKYWKEETFPVKQTVTGSSSSSPPLSDVPQPRLVGIELNPGPPKEIEVENEPEVEWQGNEAINNNEEVATSSIVLAPLDLTVECDPVAASIFTEGLHLIYSFLQRRDWLSANRTCRQWYIASQSSPYPRFPFVLRVYRYFHDPHPFAPLIQLTRQSLSYRRHISSLIFDSDVFTQASCCNGFWRLNHACFVNVEHTIDLDYIDLTAVTTFFPRLRQLKGFTLKPLQEDAMKGCIFEHLLDAEEKKLKSKHKGKAAASKTSKSNKNKAAASTPKSASQMLAPLAATRLEALWFSVQLFDMLRPVVDQILESISQHCSSLTSLALDSLDESISLTPLSSLPRLSHLALPNYLIHNQRLIPSIDGTHVLGFVFCGDYHLTKRMHELAVLPHLTALCFNNQYPEYLPQSQPELLFIEFLQKEKIYFRNLKAFWVDQLHPSEKQYRGILQEIMPNLKVWQTTMPSSTPPASSSSVAKPPAPRLVGIELNPGPPTKESDSISHDSGSDIDVGSDVEDSVAIEFSSLKVTCDSSAASVFTEGLHQIYSYLHRRDWFYASRTCRQWYIASTTSPYPRFAFTVANGCSSQCPRFLRESIPHFHTPSPLLELTRRPLRYRQHISSLIFDTDLIQSSCANGFWRLNSRCYQDVIELNTIDLKAIVGFLPKLRQLKGFILKETDSQAPLNGLVFNLRPKEKGKSKGGKQKKGKSAASKSSAVASSVSPSPTMILSALASIRIEALWFSVREIPSIASQVVDSLSTHCPSLTSLALAHLPLTVSLLPLSSLPRLSHLALTTYVDDVGFPCGNRMSEIAALTQLRALYLKTESISSHRPLLLLQFLQQEKIHFEQIKEFGMDQIHPTQEPHRTPLQVVMPNLKCWKETAGATSSSSDVPAPRLVGIALNPGPDRRRK